MLTAILLGVHIPLVIDVIMYAKLIMAVQTVITVMKSATQVMDVVNVIIVSHWMALRILQLLQIFVPLVMRTNVICLYLDVLLSISQARLVT